MTKINYLVLYSTPLKSILNSIVSIINKTNLENGAELIASLKSFLKLLEKLAQYMLITRFQTQKKVNKPKAPEMNHDLALFLDLAEFPKEKVKPEELNLLHIIKFFKLLENFMLKREWLHDIKDFQLGQFRDICQQIIDSLPTLLLSVDNLETALKTKVLNLMFSAITIYRLFKVKTVPDTTTISGPYSGDNIDIIIATLFTTELITKWLTDFLINFNVKMADLRIVMYSGNASSPNSGASTNNLYNDVAAVKSDSKLWSSIIELAGMFKNGEAFIKLITSIAENTAFNNEYIHSRLFHFSAPGGKARIIANVDWLTQTALSAIHFVLFAILKTVPSDFTFEHKAGISHVLNSEKYPDCNYYSIDLSAATDRLPRLLQARILSALFSMLGFNGERIAELWLSIVDRIFSTEGSKLNKEQPIRYEVGQGMGIFTSFAIMALMHHYIINGIVGVPFSRYCLVGDDLLFYGTKEEYQKYLDFMKSIGVTVNPGKTIVSASSEMPTIEFARNFMIQGIKLNIIPWGILFAWFDGKINLEAMAWYLLKVLDLSELVSIFKSLEIGFTIQELYALGYYIYKNIGLDFNEIKNNLNKVQTLPQWFTIANLDKIIKIVTFGLDNLKSVAFVNSEFTATYTSACIVRFKEEIERNHHIANSIRLLAVVDKSLMDITKVISDRLLHTDIIKYDTELTGGPLINKRERNLLSLIHETKTK